MLKGKLPGEGRFRVRQTFCPRMEGKLQKGKEMGAESSKPMKWPRNGAGAGSWDGHTLLALVQTGPAFWGGQLSRCIKL